MSNPTTLLVESILGYDTGKALVKITIGGESVTIDTKDAQAFAMNLLQASEASTQDFLLYKYLSEDPEFSLQRVANFIRGIRVRRQSLIE